MKEKEKKAKDKELEVLRTEEDLEAPDQRPKDPPGTGGDD